jgi:hypothetical protein
MASLSDVVNLTITEVTSAITRPGFGTPGIFAFTTAYTSGLVRQYNDLPSMITDGFTTTSAPYLAAQAVFGQNPRPPSIKILRRTAAPTYAGTLTPTAHNTTVYSGSVLTPAAPQPVTANTWTFTSSGSATVANIVTGIATAITGLSIANLTATDNTTDVTLAGTGGAVFTLSGFNPNLLDYETTTADATSSAQITACAAEDNNWYGLVSTHPGKAEAVILAAYAQSNKKLFGTASGDTGNLATTGGSDQFQALATSAYDHTFTMFVENELEYPTAAWMGAKFPINPGGENWAFTTLAGVTPNGSTYQTVLSATQYSNLAAKHANYYQNLGGVNQTFFGTVCSGNFIDVTRFFDWLYANMQLDILALLNSLSNAGQKLPYTDAGATVLQNVVSARLALGVQAGGLAPSPAPVVTVPTVASQNPSDIAARYFPNVTFSATLAGAINKAMIVGTVAV